MDTDLRISVVMAIYKNDKIEFLKQAIYSVLNQTKSADEFLIIVDGFICDIVKKYLQGLQKDVNLIKVIYLDENKGLANALNVGVNASFGDLIFRMDADDICFSERFERQYNYIIENELDIVGSQTIEFSNDISEVVSKRKVPLHHDEIVEFMRFRSPFSHPSIVFRKSIFNKINGYDCSVFPEDYDFFVRAFLASAKFGNMEKAYLWFRLGDKNQMLKRRHGFKYAMDEIKLYKRFYKIGFYTLSDFLKNFMVKIPLRILPFRFFVFLYSLSRKKM